VVQIITDNAANCKGAGLIIQQKYEMWDTMIENVKKVIYTKEKKQDDEQSTFFSIVLDILVDCWTKSNTPLHCLAHSLNPR